LWALATALIDRVIHHANVIAIEGESYRLREAEKRSGKTVDRVNRWDGSSSIREELPRRRSTPP
jgi:IstB-like ATP binding protein